MGHDAEQRVELVLPLAQERPGHDDKNAGSALGQQLGNHEPGFDGLAEPHLVGQNAAALGDAAQGEHHRVDLVRVRVDSAEALRRCVPSLFG